MRAGGRHRCGLPRRKVRTCGRSKTPGAGINRQASAANAPGLCAWFQVCPCSLADTRRRTAGEQKSPHSQASPRTHILEQHLKLLVFSRTKWRRIRTFDREIRSLLLYPTELSSVPMTGIEPALPPQRRRSTAELQRPVVPDQTVRHPYMELAGPADAGGDSSP
jgi:hypothetical protein